MIVALRCVEKESGYGEVRTGVAVEQHISLPQFQEHEAIAPLATRAIQEPGVWAEVTYRKAHKDGE